MRRWIDSLPDFGVFLAAVVPVLVLFIGSLFAADRFDFVANEHTSIKNGCVVVRYESPIGRTIKTERKC